MTKVNYFAIIPQLAKIVKSVIHKRNKKIEYKPFNLRALGGARKMKTVLLNPSRSLHLGRSLSERDADTLIAELFQLNKTEGPIYLQINSPGGSAPGANKLYDNIVNSPNPVIGVVVGDCFSMAATILQACDRRYASKHSRLHIHHVTHPGFILRHNDTVKSLRKKLLEGIELAQKDDKILIDILEKRMKISRKEIIAIMDKDEAITPERALEIGLIDVIID